jgi:uncharacterized membrane protein
MENQKSAIGLDGNVTALIGYIIGIVAIVLIFIEKDNKFVRFHSFQSVFFHVGFFVLYFILAIIIGALAQVSSAFAFLGLLLLPLWLVWLAGMIYGAVKAYQGTMFKYPVIGNIAENMSNK